MYAFKLHFCGWVVTHNDPRALKALARGLIATGRGCSIESPSGTIILEWEPGDPVPEIPAA